MPAAQAKIEKISLAAVDAILKDFPIKCFEGQ